MIRRNLMAVASVTAMTIALAGCGPSPQQQQQAAYQAGLQAGQQAQQVQYQPPAQDLSQRSFSTVQECLASGQYSQAVCESTYSQSVAALPHYNSYSMCQAQGYSNCEDHGGWFGPAFAGFMLGSMLNGAYHPVPLYLGSGGYIYSPYGSLGYAPRSYYVGGRVHYGIPAGHTTVVIHNYSAARPLPPVAARPAPPVVSRGGMATGAPASARQYGAAPTPVSSPNRGGFGGSPAPTVQRTGGFGGGMGSASPARQSSGFHMTSSSSSSSSSHSSGGSSSHFS